MPNKDSDRPLHPGSLIRGFAVHLKTLHHWLPTECPAKTDITKTCLYNFDPHKPHFHIVKLAFTGVYRGIQGQF